MNRNKLPNTLFNSLFVSLVFAGLYIISVDRFVLFHALIELICVIIGSSIFIFAWNTQVQMDNHFFVWLGISFVFTSLIDMIHLLTYKDMNLIPGTTANLPTQLWIAARFLQSTTFLAGFFFLKRKCNSRFMVIGFLCAVIILLSLISLKFFPICFHPDTGLTQFKRLAEYGISLAFFLSILLLFLNRHYFDRCTFWLLTLSLVFNIAAELMFTLYVNVFDTINALGHFFKLIAYLSFYSAIIEVGLKQPQDFLYRQLKKKEELLKESLKASERIAVTDYLTGSFNRRYFVDQMIFELQRANRYRRELSIIMVDLNNFKQVNDQFGHSVGDEVLKQFSQWLVSQVRKIDIVARFGGDEFVMLVPETNEKGITELLERLKLDLEAHPFEVSSQTIMLTASFGCASYGPDSLSMDQMLNKADKLLYREKIDQRNPGDSLI